MTLKIPLLPNLYRLIREEKEENRKEEYVPENAC